MKKQFSLLFVIFLISLFSVSASEIAPTVNLYRPTVGEVFTISTINLQFSYTDDLTSTLFCRVYINDKYIGGYQANNNTKIIAGVVVNNYIDGAPNEIYVSCKDEHNNVGLSETHTFYICKDTNCLPKCGLAEGNYLWNEEEFREPLCEIGNLVQMPNFPNNGETVTWECIDIFESNTIECSATRDNAPLDAVCGLAEGTYSWNANGFREPFCSEGVLDETPNFPDNEETVTWQCNGLYGGDNFECNATRNAVPIDAVCGIANGTFDYGTTFNLSEEFCALGEPNQSITFPTEPGTVFWTCVIETGEDASCSATLNEPLNCNEEITWLNYCSNTIILNHNENNFFNNINENYSGSANFSCYNGVLTYDNETCKEIINGVCGSAATNYAWNLTSYPEEIDFCQTGSLFNGEIVAKYQPNFPDNDETISWTCFGNDYGTDVTCEASRDPLPEAQCGNAATNYAWNVNNYPGDAIFCETGEIEVNPSFPNQGQTVSWTCILYNEFETTCEASRSTQPATGGGGGAPAATGGTGGGSTICRTEWSCSEWSSCVNGLQTRTCSFPENFCEPLTERPIEQQSCEIVQETEETETVEETITETEQTTQETEETETNGSRIIFQQREDTINETEEVEAPVTGFVIGTTGTILGSILGILLIAGLIYFFVAGRKKKKE